MNLIRNALGALGVEKLTEGPESSSSSFQYSVWNFIRNALGALGVES